MDHSHMDHSGHMDHGGHGGGDGGMEPMCNMNMLFTWDTENLCIVFSQWHIRSTASLLISLVVVVLLGVGYEALRAASRRYELSLTKQIESIPHHNNISESVTENTPFLPSGQNQAAAGQRVHLTKSILYGVQNFYAFMLMLVFMTYNGWVMISVSLGAFLGYYFFGGETSSTKENACH